MTNHINDGGPAFPTRPDQYHVAGQGMTLRDWFAGQALAGLATLSADCGPRGVALDAYAYADAMLEARK